MLGAGTLYCCDRLRMDGGDDLIVVKASGDNMPLVPVQ